MNYSRSFRFALLVLALAAPIAAQSVSVNSTSPSSAAQGTLNLNVTISGKGFKNGAQSRFFVTGTTDPGGIVVHSTTFVNSTQLVANIDVTSTAVISGFDVAVDDQDGHSGKGTDIFSVVATTTGANACVLYGLPDAFSPLGALNSAGYAGFGNELAAGITTIAKYNVVMTVVGGTVTINGTQYGQVNVFFLDPVTGATLDDGPLGQPHLTVNLPDFLATGDVLIGDFNNDKVPDILIGRAGWSAWVLLGKLDSNGYLSYPSAAIDLNPNDPTSAGFGSAIAAADIDGSGLQTIAVGAIGGQGFAGSVPGKVFLFKYNGTKFDITQTLTDPQNSTTGNFGSALAFGDITGDGRMELAVGATAATGTISKNGNAGRVWIYSGPPYANSNAYYLTTNTKNDELGRRVGIGHLGFSSAYRDLLAVTGLDSTNPRGLVYAGPVTSSSSPAATLLPISGTMSAYFPSGISIGDINGDGLADVIIGAQNAGPSTGCPAPGAAYVYLSTANGSGGNSGYKRYTLQPSGVNQAYGWRVAAVDGTRLFLISSQEDSQVWVYSVK